ncbi:hypothetical protein BEWA_019220 [Theileria equi strain WA]|uniref:Uncharacterized protein n=1 Tax=Theileria equi strain WA TaxID=1537102 RepID=L0ATV3_THEEQ|nr:hypothetical protein BEWA_019220 [Theileria equi strain WA]AFZ79077.1 hypothetical protein BEWA_019220 [Theileria equi strain WA]|eukprot:XP_004828743.1 hypothetical protein BEWA_019220 [Theileria equi strain WA]
MFKITAHELDKFNNLKEGSHTPTNRFTQVAQIPNEYNIRESLYSTQLRRSQPQANVAIDIVEVAF